MYRVTTGIHVHFGHHVHGHAGPCISLHGHTWKLELTLAAESLDGGGFVVDFDVVQQRVLEPAHRLLDHSLALSRVCFEQNRASLEALGSNLVATRQDTLGNLGCTQPVLEGDMQGARNELPGGIKIAVFPFAPTSERLAWWLYQVADEQFRSDRVHVARARILESLHPVECIAEYTA